MQTKQGKKQTIAGVIVAALIAILYLPVFLWLVQGWLDDPYYRHGFLIPIVSGFIFWLRRDNLKLRRPSSLGVTVLAAGLVLYTSSYIVRMHWLMAFSFPIVVFGTIAFLCGKERAKSFTFPTLFLIFMIPVPFLTSVSYHLQTITTFLSATIIRSFGIQVIATGNQVELTNVSFTIGTPCSGISSLISLLALSALLSFLLDGSFWKRGILFLSAVPIAILANTLRVTSILLIGNQWGYQAAMNFFHVFSSILLFLSAIALLILIAKLLRLRARTLTELSHG